MKRYATLQVTDLKRDDRIDDAELVARIREKDGWAEEALYHRYVHKITCIAAKLLRNSADIEDAVQDTFIQAFRDIHQLREPRYVERWLVGIVLHRAHHRFRRRSLMRKLGLDRSVDDEPLALQAGAAAPQEARAELALLDAVFDRMEIRNRMCVILRYFEGYSVTQIAAAMNCSLATVKRRLAEGKKQIKQHLEATGHG